MAIDWYFKQDDQEQGPYTFRDLVEMVREETLLPETPVRPHYLDEWQRADAIVGLYYMARRDPATLPEIQEPFLDADAELAAESDLDSFLAETNEAVSATDSGLSDPDADKPGWLRRLLSLRRSPIPPVPVKTSSETSASSRSGEEPHAEFAPADPTNALQETTSPAALSAENVAGVEDTDDSTGAFSDETWESTVQAAVDRVDARAPKPEEQPEIRPLVPAVSLSFLESPTVRKLLFVGALVLCVGAGIYGLIQWMGQGKLYFPLIGETSPLLFLVYSACLFVAILFLVPLLSGIASRYLRFGYKLGSAVVTASLTVLFLLNWSEQQNMIFPARKPTETKLVFPLMGECSEFAYWMYFVDVVIFIAVLTYFAAWWLESRADEV